MDVTATISLAGRVSSPKPQDLPVRVGGFGGVEGLKEYLRQVGVTHVIDATHPFASQMSTHAILACGACNIPLIGLVRPPWRARPEDTWIHVPDIDGAVKAMDRPASRVFLAVGRMHLGAFTTHTQHHYVLRLVDAPDQKIPLSQTTVIVDRGPFDVAGDMSLMQSQKIDLVVSKNAGGSGAVAKITVARQLRIPVIMIDRPIIPPRHEVESVEAALNWLRDHDADLGV